MNRENDSELDELRPEYDFSQLQHAVRGKYVERYREGARYVRLAPDIASAFPDDEAVNEALRLLVNLARTTMKQAS